MHGTNMKITFCLCLSITNTVCDKGPLEIIQFPYGNSRQSYNKMAAERTCLISILIAPVGPSMCWDAHTHSGYNRHTASIRSRVNHCEYDDGTEVWDSLVQMNVVRMCYSGNCVQHKGVIMPIHYKSDHTQSAVFQQRERGVESHTKHGWCYVV